MPNSNYNNFNSEDFLADADFLRYVKKANQQDVQFWESWLKDEPENKAAFLQARLQLQIILSSKDRVISATQADALLDRINQSIDGLVHKRRLRIRRMIWSSGIAASLLLILFGVWFFNSTVHINTTFGESKLVLLPDGSEVRMNANSSLSYPRAFKWTKNRVVLLTGEAFFKVKHFNQNPSAVKNGELFIAQSNKLKVEVLGTVFNLKSRPNVNEVTLIKGKVRVKAIASGEARILKPGEMARLGTDSRFMVNVTSTVPQTSWIGNKILMTQTRVGDIIAEFENLYGYKVILPDTTMADKRIDGTISTLNGESMLFVLKNILNVNERREGKTIYLERR